LRIRVVLVGIEGSMNLGVIVRTCKNFNVDEIFLVKPSADLGEASRYVAKASDLFERMIIVDDLEDALKNIDLVVATSAKGYGVGDVLRQALSLDDFLEIIKKGVNSLAILFGRESTGLTRDEIMHADLLVTIPANPEYPVLNVSQAVAIFLYELWKLRGFETTNIPPRIGRSDFENLMKLVDNITRMIVSDEAKAKRLSLTWRRVLYRSRLSVYEDRLLVYWFRRVLSRLRRSYSG